MLTQQLRIENQGECDNGFHVCALTINQANQTNSLCEAMVRGKEMTE